MAHTLWGEMAYQIGGEELYGEVKEQAESYAFDGSRFLDQVIGDKKVLIMIDELAQYSTRMEAAHSGGGDAVAAFLMSLHNYARNHSNVSVVLTLASVGDAFSKQTESLRKMISKVKGGHEISEAKAHSIAKKAIDSAVSVKSRDADSIVPVQASEISHVLARRLFESIDHDGAVDTITKYAEMYEKHSYMLSERYTLSSLKESMLATYPFHITFINFLNDKMSTLETFQGTRGVLRTLAITIRSIWEKKLDIPMIHTCHLDLRDTRTVNELLGRNQCTELIQIINSDIGSADTSSMAFTTSMAEGLDKKNPHPLGLPLYEYTWRTIFLNSLVGRSEGLGSNIFGVTEKDAILQTSFPGMPPAQVESALKAIPETALYLKNKQGRYFASLEPTITNILIKIKNGIGKAKALELLDNACRKIIKQEAVEFSVVHDVARPEDILDKAPKPILAVININAERINVDNMVTLAGENRARINQNLVFLLVPNTVIVDGEAGGNSLFRDSTETKDELLEIARDVKARQILKSSPQQYGLNEKHLKEDDFDIKIKERENALQTRVAQHYNALYYPATTGKIIKKDIKTSGGEGGASFAAEIRRVLKDAGELITSDISENTATLTGLAKLFFESDKTPEIKKLGDGFSQKRHWPILESSGILEQVIRAGVKKGYWCLFKMGDSENPIPEKIFHRDKGDIPFELDFISLPEWSLILATEANKHGWLVGKIEKGKVEEFVKDAINSGGAVVVKDIVAMVKDRHGDMGEANVIRAVEELVTNGKLIAYNGRPNQQDKPSEIKTGSTALMYHAPDDGVVITIAEASKRGWMDVAVKKFELNDQDEAAKAILPLLKRIGSMYSKGAKSTINSLDIFEINLKKGGKLRVSLSDTKPETLKELGEFFEVLNTLIVDKDNVGAYIRIDDPDETCDFYKQIKEKIGK